MSSTKIQDEIEEHENEAAKLRYRQALLAAGWPANLADIHMAALPHAVGWEVAEMYLDTQIGDGHGDQVIRSVPTMRGYPDRVRAGLTIVGLFRGQTHGIARQTLAAVRERIAAEVAS